ncbi:transglutaminase TgpA family protein [Xanthomonas melonis]|uniref:transglutaminase TgpA family protein n=1 Tax=Xanthomonas melonis TaxID=56456 RepID=UPI003EBA81B0
MTEPAAPIALASRGWVLATSWLALAPLLLQLPGLLAATIAVAAVLVGVLSWRGTLMAPVRLLLVVAMLAAVYWQIGMRFGRDTGCAVLAAMLAIKASELRTLRDARSLLGFALFAPFAAFLLDQGPATMGLALLAVATALLSMQRLADEEHRTSTPALGLQLRGIGKLVAIGVPLALVTFWLLPRLGAPLWGVPERALSRPGLSDNMSPGEWIDLMADDNPALRVQFAGRAPPPQQRYWRGPVMWDFDGRSWQRARWTGRGQPAAVVSGPQTYRYRLDYEPTDRRQLVSLDLPTSNVANAELSPDYELFAQRPLTALTRWELQSAPPARFDTDLPDRLRARALALPPGFNPRTLALARQWRAEAGNDDGAVVQRALQWITREFAYTLDTPLLGRNSVDEFLFQQKAGFCEHFSSSFVVLMRGAGIPARVVTGYTGGVYNGLGNYWVVRRMDAHAWAEVWLAGRGWVRVDPTAAVAPERIYDTLEDRLQAGGGNDFAQLRTWAGLGQVSDWLRRGWNELVLSFDAERQQRLLQPFGIDRLDTSQLTLIFGIFAGGALAWMGWLLARGERERDPLLRAWHRVGRRYRKLGLAREPHEPATVWAQRVAREHPGTPLLALSQRFAAARYAGASLDSATLLKDLQQHRPRTGDSS